MKAVVFYGKNDIKIENVPDPKNKPDNMIVKVLACSICGTDLKSFMFGNPKIIAPRIMGHEMVGHVIHVGEEVCGFKEGDYVTLATTIACGRCYYCEKGLENLCLNTKPISAYYDGAFAEYIELNHQVIKQGNVIKIPSDVNCEKYALCEPLSCTINAHALANVKSGDTVVIVGGGPLGALHAELAKAEKAKNVFVVALSSRRIKYLKNLKDVVLLDSSAVDAAETIRKATNGLGADVIMVCAPTVDAMEKSFLFAKKSGCICLFASLPKDMSMIHIDSRIIHYNELKVIGVSDSRKEHVQKAVEMIHQGKICVDNIITHSLGLNDIFHGFELMRNRDCLKVLIH